MQLVDQKELADKLGALRREIFLFQEKGLKHATDGRTRGISMARTNCEFGRGWLGKAFGCLSASSPERAYPESYKPENCFVDPTRDAVDVDENFDYFSELGPDAQPVQKVKQLRNVASQLYYAVAALRHNVAPHEKLANTQNDGGLNLYEALSSALYYFHDLSMSLGFEVQDMLNDGRGGAVPTPPREFTAKEAAADLAAIRADSEPADMFKKNLLEATKLDLEGKTEPGATKSGAKLTGQPSTDGNEKSESLSNKSSSSDPIDSGDTEKTNTPQESYADAEWVNSPRPQQHNSFSENENSENENSSAPVEATPASSAPEDTSTSTKNVSETLKTSSESLPASEKSIRPSGESAAEPTTKTADSLSLPGTEGSSSPQPEVDSTTSRPKKSSSTPNATPIEWPSATDQNESGFQHLDMGEPLPPLNEAGADKDSKAASKTDPDLTTDASPTKTSKSSSRKSTKKPAANG